MSEHEGLLDNEGALDKVRGWLALYVLECILVLVWYFLHMPPIPLSLLSWFGLANCFACGGAALLIILRNRLALPIVAVQIGLRLLGLCYVAYLGSKIHGLSNISNAVVENVGVGFVLTIGWLMYFRMSRRVHNVFGRNL